MIRQQGLSSCCQFAATTKDLAEQCATEFAKAVLRMQCTDAHVVSGFRLLILMWWMMGLVYVWFALYVPYCCLYWVCNNTCDLCWLMCLTS